MGNEWLYVYLLPLLGAVGFALFIWLLIFSFRKGRRGYARPVLVFGLLLALFGVLGSELAARSDAFHIAALFFAQFIWWVIVLSAFRRFAGVNKSSV